MKKPRYLGYFVAGLVLDVVLWDVMSHFVPAWGAPFTVSMGIAYWWGWFARATVPGAKRENEVGA